MRYQIWILAATFIDFGVIGTAIQAFGVTYLGLMLFGVACFTIGLKSSK